LFLSGKIELFLSSQLTICSFQEKLKIFLKDPRVDIHAGVNRPNILYKIASRGNLIQLKWLIASGKDFDPEEEIVFYGCLPGSMSYWASDKRSPFYNLLTNFACDPVKTRYKVQLELCPNILPFDLFALVVFNSDGFLERKKEDERFFKIAGKLPMELQMILCYRVYGLSKNNIPGKEFELGAKRLVAKIKS